MIHRPVNHAVHQPIHRPAYYTQGAAEPPFVRTPVTFNAAPYLNRGANLTGFASPNTFQRLFFYSKFNVASLSANRFLLTGGPTGSNSFNVQVSTAGAVLVSCMWGSELGEQQVGQTNQIILDAGTIITGEDYHLMIALDAVGEGSGSVWVGAYDDTGSVVDQQYNNALDFGSDYAISFENSQLTYANWRIGRPNTTGTAYFSGTISELVLMAATGTATWPTAYDFMNADGSDRNLDSFAPAGWTFPIRFGGNQGANDLAGNVAQGWNDGYNRGTGGAFTMTNGTVT